ncbi:MAG: hypothetical protein NVSMB9_28520 [Isosphaeraceae bacterium]
MLSKAQILAADDLRRDVVEVPMWGGSVHVRTLRLSERLALEKALADAPVNALAILVAASVCDDQGVLLFSPDDIPALEAKSVEALSILAPAITRLNKITTSDVEELAKNSGPTPPNASPTDSPRT